MSKKSQKATGEIMDKTILAIAETYYTSIGKRDIASVEKYLHPDVVFVGPLSSLVGKEALLDATRKFAAFFKSLTVRAKFASDTQTVIIYEMEFPGPIGKISSSSLMTFQNGLITKMELFYDGRPFEAKKEEIFAGTKN